MRPSIVWTTTRVLIQAVGTSNLRYTSTSSQQQRPFLLSRSVSMASSFSSNNEDRSTSSSSSSSSHEAVVPANKKKRSSLQEALRTIGDNGEDSIFLLDGGTGEELFRRGVPDDRKMWSATAIVHSQYHTILEQVHSSFLQAGARAITTNSYGIVPGVGFTDDKERSRYIAIAGEIARRAVSKHPAKPAAFVLGSLGPLVESYRPDLIRSNHAEGVEEYGVACRALEPYVDAFLAETMSCWEESSQALDAVAALTTTTSPLPVMVSYTLDSKGNLRDGQVVTECLYKLLEYTQEKKLDLLAILFNCCEPEAITIALARIAANIELSSRLKKSKVLLGAYANRLTTVDPQWSLVGSEAAQPFRQDLDEGHYWSEFVKVWTSDDLGVKLVGGCCGMTPEHISFIHNQLLVKHATHNR